MTFSLSRIKEENVIKQSVAQRSVFLFLNPPERAARGAESICIDGAAVRLVMTAKSQCMMETQRARDCRMKVDSQEISSHLGT